MKVKEKGIQEDQFSLPYRRQKMLRAELTSYGIPKLTSQDFGELAGLWSVCVH